MKKINNISTKKIFNFRSNNPDYWNEGLNDDFIIKKVIPRFKAWRENTGMAPLLFKVFYWKEADSYVIQDQITSGVYCVTKPYLEQKIHEIS